MTLSGSNISNKEYNLELKYVGPKIKHLPFLSTLK